MNYANEAYIVSYNMHGFNQGIELIKDIVCDSNSPVIILIQEHWLTPANMYRFEQDITSHFALGKSAMSHCVAQGPLVGRPYGGALILIKNELRGVTTCVYLSLIHI